MLWRFYFAVHFPQYFQCHLSAKLQTGYKKVEGGAKMLWTFSVTMALLSGSDFTCCWGRVASEKGFSELFSCLQVHIDKAGGHFEYFS